MKKMKKIKGLHELYEKDPIVADKIVWGRESNAITRRGFLKNSGLLTMSAALGSSIPFSKYFPAGMIPAAYAQTEELFDLYGKNGLTLLNDRPLNAETPAHLLDDFVTPSSRLFVRNNGIPPFESEIDLENWSISISGESCINQINITLKDIKEKFEHHTMQLQMECGGNGRSEFSPPARGNQWSTGAIGCPEWTGIRIRDLLDYVGIKDDAVYVAYEGKDRHLSGDINKKPISRGVPLWKAMQDESLIVWAMNGEPLPLIHGAPVRMLCPGWPASVSGKWLNRILIRNIVHDGEKMAGQSYRVPCKPVAPGSSVADEDMCIIESMPVKSIITFPQSGLTHKKNTPLKIRGHAWAGDNEVKKLFCSYDFGASWMAAKLSKPINTHSWQHWSHEINFPVDGYYEVWARAEDDNGKSQPVVLPQWNPRGYLNNACHRIAVSVKS